MLHRSRAIFLLLTIVAVLLVSAVGTTSVYADDGNPPPPPTEAAEVDPPTGEGEAAPTEPAEVEPPAGEGETASVEPVATEPPVAEPLEEVAPTEAAPVVEETPLEEVAPVVEEPLPAEEVVDVASILEQVPDDTTVTVLNTEGEAQPLTSQESADAILSGDPIWCPLVNGFPTPPGGAGCTQEFPSFAALLTFLDENEAAYNQAGAIYVEMGAYAGGESSIDFNAYDFQLIRNNDLVVQGGWNTTTNTTTDSTLFNIPLVIGSSTNPWAGSLTINNISINQVYNQTGLTLFSLEDITLSSVQVTESQNGADLIAGGEVFIENSKFNRNKKFGARINAGGIVNVLNNGTDPEARTEFDNNGTFGLEIDSLNEVILNRVSAQNNKSFGADINATGFVDVENSIFSGNFYCSSCSHSPSGGYGLKIVTTDSVFMDNVTANKNYYFGAHVEAIDTEIYNSSFNENGSRSMSNPKGYGLEILGTGFVWLEGIHADKNQLFGASIETTTDQTSASEVTILSSFFDGNKSYKTSCNGTTYHGYGLKVATNNDINMGFVSARGNNLAGAQLKGLDVLIIGEVADGVYNSDFSNNGTGNQTLTGRGLEILSAREVTIDTIKANSNQLFGADIQATGNVAISDSLFNGHKYTYSSSCKGTVTVGGYGLHVVTNGEIAIDSVEATGNYLYGAKLEKLEGSDPELGVAISNGLFSNNQSGLQVKSASFVSLLNVTASENKLFGADIEATGNVSVGSSFFNGNKSYTSSSYKGKTYYGYGLKVVTAAAISVDTVTAENNYVLGAYLQGTDITAADSIFSNNGTGVLSDHVGKGLEVKSTGAESLVSLSNVTANNNQLFGADVKADGEVKVDNSFFNGNKSYTSSSCKGKTYDGYGLRVFTTSDVQLNNVEAKFNYLFGAHLEGANVEVANSQFNENASPLQQDKAPTGRGLEVISTGDTLLTNVQANKNQLFGADVRAGGKVEVTSSFFEENIYYTYSSCKGTKSAGYGLKVVTTDPVLGTIALTTVNALANGAEGAILQSTAVVPDGSAVQVTGGSFSNNGASGLVITASGNVTLKDITADANKGNGVDVKGVCTNTVYVNNGTFTNNSRYGIKIVNAAYSPTGIQTFANNGSGNVFQDSSACASSTNDNSQVQSSSAASNNSSSGYSSWNWYVYNRYHHHR